MDENMIDAEQMAKLSKVFAEKFKDQLDKEGLAIEKKWVINLGKFAIGFMIVDIGGGFALKIGKILKIKRSKKKDLNDEQMDDIKNSAEDAEFRDN